MPPKKVAIDINSRLEFHPLQNDKWVDATLFPSKDNELSVSVLVKKISESGRISEARRATHENVLLCYEYVDGEHESPTARGICIVERAELGLEKHVLSNPNYFISKKRVTTQFKQNIREILDALIFLHALQICHGNIRLETTWYKPLSNGTIRIKLNHLIDNPYGTNASLVFSSEESNKDWRDVGKMLEQVETVAKKAFVSKHKRVAMADMAVDLEFQDLYRRLKSPSIDINKVKEMRRSHPLFYGYKERTSLLVTFADRMKHMSTGHRLLKKLEDQDTKLKLVPSLPWISEIDKVVFSYVSSNREPTTPDYDGNSGRSYISFVRNSIDHSTHLSSVVKGFVGPARHRVISYFEQKQPYMFLMLYELAKEINLDIVCSFLKGDDAF